MGREFLRIMESPEVEEILENLFNELYPVRETEEISTKDSYHRILAKNINATMDLPPFDRASRDGYAVKVEDTFGATDENPQALQLLELVEAGDVPKLEVTGGKCTEINTGAPMPPGADGVVMVEFTEKVGDEVHIYKSSHHGQYVTTRGTDVLEGDLVLKQGTLLTPDKIGVLSAMGYDKIPVFARPKVAVISTGNELVEVPQKLEYGQIYDVNSQTIQSAVESCGAEPISGGIVKDNYQDIASAITESLKKADMVITSGSTSAGTGDYLRQVLDDMGEVMVHGISVKPGKPTIVGKVDNKLVLGLPGYPVAALMIFQIFMVPFLRKLGGYELQETFETITLPLANRFYSSQGRMQYALVKIKESKVHPILKDSGAITALAEADGYIKIPKNVEILEEGSDVEIMLFGVA